MHEDLVTNADKITNLESALVHKHNRHALAEDRLHWEQRETVERLTQRLNDTLARVDRLFVDLAKERPLQDVAPPPLHEFAHPRLPASPVPYVRPLQFVQGDEIMVDANKTRRMPTFSPQVDHHKRHRSV